MEHFLLLLPDPINGKCFSSLCTGIEIYPLFDYAISILRRRRRRASEYRKLIFDVAICQLNDIHR